MDAMSPASAVVPFSLKDAPSLIEKVWPAQKISVEAQKERKANLGQTLTGLGSYWKGRKPLILVRACLFGALLPATGDDEADLALFELLVGIADDQVSSRHTGKPLSGQDIAAYATPSEQATLALKTLSKEARTAMACEILARMPYSQRVEKLLRPEEVAEEELTGKRLDAINSRLGTVIRCSSRPDTSPVKTLPTA
jgi:hypothetical protein